MNKTLGLLSGFILLIMLLSACRTPAPVLTSTPPALETPQFAEGREIYRSGLIESAQPILAELPGATEYRLDITIAADYLSVQGHESIRYTNRESDSLDAIYLRLFPNIAGGDLTVSSVTIAAQPVQPVEEAYRSSLRLPLAAPLAPQDAVELELDFALTLPTEMGGNYGLLGFFDDILVLDTFYPVIPVYDAQGWNVSVPPPNGDLPYFDVSFYQVRVTAPANLVMAASGLAVDQKVNADWQTVTYAVGPARDFYLAASEQFVRTTQVANGVTVNCYAFADRAEASAQALQVVVAALEHFGARFGPYPYTEFDVVSTPMLALGVEYPPSRPSTWNYLTLQPSFAESRPMSGWNLSLPTKWRINGSIIWSAMIRQTSPGWTKPRPNTAPTCIIWINMGWPLPMNTAANGLPGGRGLTRPKSPSACLPAIMLLRNTAPLSMDAALSSCSIWPKPWAKLALMPFCQPMPINISGALRPPRISEPWLNNPVIVTSRRCLLTGSMAPESHASQAITRAQLAGNSKTARLHCTRTWSGGFNASFSQPSVSPVSRTSN